MDKPYKLRFLPLFETDLNMIVDYISIHLQNPEAAERLVDDVEDAINERLNNPESFEPYRTESGHPYPYYYIRVRNYLVFYVVIDDVMEVRRIVYGRRDLSKQL